MITSFKFFFYWTVILNLRRWLPLNCTFVLKSSFSKLSKCFQRLTSRNSRTVLCDVISAMATKMVSMEEAGRYVQDMNAWDKKRLDEPDYTRRLAAFKQLNQKVLKMTGDINAVFYSFMLDNCFHFVLRVSQISLLTSHISFC